MFRLARKGIALQKPFDEGASRPQSRRGSRRRLAPTPPESPGPPPWPAALGEGGRCRGNVRGKVAEAKRKRYPFALQPPACKRSMRTDPLRMSPKKIVNRFEVLSISRDCWPLLASRLSSGVGICFVRRCDTTCCLSSLPPDMAPAPTATTVCKLCLLFCAIPTSLGRTGSSIRTA